MNDVREEVPSKVTVHFIRIIWVSSNEVPVRLLSLSHESRFLMMIVALLNGTLMIADE